ncbi:STAS domain-containing protein [Streptomyces sp. NPDC060027]|uniref:STAS domain-containing protein n=1 Tax=Streptomyces sp. NPDC060027 TaxID=3347040 RepID=UPI0036A0F6FD
MRADELLQTHTLRYGETVLLRLTGELDLATAPLLHQALTTALAGHPRTLCLDLTSLTFCDGTGLRALNRLTHQVHTTHTSLHLTGLHPNLYRTLDLLKTAPPLDPTPCSRSDNRHQTADARPAALIRKQSTDRSRACGRAPGQALHQPLRHRRRCPACRRPGSAPLMRPAGETAGRSRVTPCAACRHRR